MAVVKKEEEEEEEGWMPAEEERMLVAGVVVEGAWDEAFSVGIQVFGEFFSADGESIEKELLAGILVNPALTDVRGECSRERFLRLRG